MASMDRPTKTNRGRTTLFAPCFKLTAVDDDDGDQELGCDSASPPLSADKSGGRRKKRVRRSLSVAVKAVFSKTSSLKKSRSESSKQDFDLPTSTNLLSKSKRLVKSMKKNLSCTSFWEPAEEIFRTDSNSSSLFSSNSSRRTASSISSSSSASSLSSSSMSESDTIKRSVSLDLRQMNPIMESQKSIKRDCGKKSSPCIYYNSPTLEMSVLMVCLVALVFWGKAFAILTCTSTWLFLAPRRRGKRFRRVDSLNDVVDTEDYKKRVIMEGLLERNRSRVLQL